MMKEFNGEMMRVLRNYKIDGVQYVDLRAQSGEDFKSVPVNDLGKKSLAKTSNTPKERMIQFEKNGAVTKFAYESAEYNTFIKKEKLNKAMIDNALEGTIKTHKGYVITEEK